MKDSKLYGDRIKKLHRTLKRSGTKVQPVSYEDPLEALVYGLLSEPVTESQAQAAHKRMARHFVTSTTSGWPGRMRSWICSARIPRLCTRRPGD